MALDDLEIARRINAALAYAALGRGTRRVREDLVEILDMSDRTLDRTLGKGVKFPDGIRHAHWDELQKIADYCELPPEFFSADFDKLPQIVPAGGTLVRRPTAAPAGPSEAAEFRVPQAKSVPPVDPGRTPQTPRPAHTEGDGPARREDGSRKRASSRRSR